MLPFFFFFLLAEVYQTKTHNSQFFFSTRRWSFSYSDFFSSLTELNCSAFWMKNIYVKLEFLIAAIFLNDTFHTQTINDSWGFFSSLFKGKLKAHSAGYFHISWGTSCEIYTGMKIFWKFLICCCTTICSDCKISIVVHFYDYHLYYS